MNKARTESFSDGVFSIVLTLLIFTIHVPVLTGTVTSSELWTVLGSLSPQIASYALSFLVISVFWVNHNFLFHSYMKELDRNLNFMNLIYLLFLVFVPFSASLFGTYPYNQTAALIYGLNIMAVIILQASIVRYLSHHKDLRNELPSRLIKQARIRTTLTEVSYVLGIIFSFLFIPVSIFFYLFPMLFNIIPGTLNTVEKIFKFELS
jgi:uncharacterized membrane protein